MIIYKSTNKINNKCYIGQTVFSLNRRRNNHTSCKDTYFSHALNKYGKDNFTWEVLEECDSKEELDEMEFHYIKQYNSKSPNGYNLTDGGDKGTWGWIPTEKTKQSISNSLNEKLKNDIEYKNKIMKNMEKLVLINKIKNPMLGKKYTKEEKEIQKNSNAIYEYEFISPDNEVIITNSIRDFSRMYKLDRSSLMNLVNGKIKTSIYKGWRGKITKILNRNVINDNL